MLAAPLPPVRSPIFIFSPPEPNLILDGALISPFTTMLPSTSTLPLTVSISDGMVVPIPTLEVVPIPTPFVPSKNPVAPPLNTAVTIATCPV